LTTRVFCAILLLSRRDNDKEAKENKKMVVGKMVGLLILWFGVALYPLADDDDTPRTWHKFLQNLLDSTPIIIGALLMTCL